MKNQRQEEEKGSCGPKEMAKTNEESQKEVIGTLDAAIPWIFIKQMQRGGDSDY